MQGDIATTDLAYLAGLIDGEGYVGIKKATYRLNGMVSPSYQERVQIKMVDEPAIAFLAATLGGNYHLSSYTTSARCRPLYSYQAACQKARNILIALMPYLRVKHEVATVVLELDALKREKRAWRALISEESLAAREALYLRCKELNRPGVQLTASSTGSAAPM